MGKKSFRIPGSKKMKAIKRALGNGRNKYDHEVSLFAYHDRMKFKIIWLAFPGLKGPVHEKFSMKWDMNEGMRERW